MESVLSNPYRQFLRALYVMITFLHPAAKKKIILDCGQNGA
jgi:hypothetical protein